MTVRKSNKGVSNAKQWVSKAAENTQKHKNKSQNKAKRCLQGKL